MSQALLQLRRAIVAGQKLSVDSSSVILDDKTRLDRKAPTNFRSLHGRGPAYPLEVIYYQYHFRQLPYNQYFQACRDEGVQHVTLIDKKDVVAYLTGAIDSCPAISSEPKATLQHPTVPPTSAPRPRSPRKSSTNLPATASPQPPVRSPTTYAALRHRVRDQRALDSVLITKDWDYASLRDKLSHHVAAARKAKPSAAENPSSRSKNSSSSFDPRGDRYTNNEDRFWRENLGSDFHDLGIDMSGSFKAKPSSAPPSNGSRPRDRERERERERERPDARRSAPPPSSSKENPQKRKKIMDPRKAIPIIIVPSSISSSLVGGANALELLQNSRYMSYEEMRKNQTKNTQSARVSMLRQPGGNCSKAEYHIVTNPSRIAREEWDQVVAVVCTGQRWQFSSWPIFNGSTPDLFRKVQGFYFHYDDISPVNGIEAWGIKKLSISRERRHTDSQVHTQFWSSVDSFVARNRFPLRY